MESKAEALQAPIDWDARYRKGWAYGKQPSRFLADMAAAHLPADDAPLDILSLGEGQGRHVVHLAALGHRCIGVDSSSVGLAKARTLAEERGVSDRVETMHAALEQFDPAVNESRWHAVVSIYCALEPVHRLRLHRACARALRPGGVIIVECFAPRQQEAESPCVDGTRGQNNGDGDEDGDDASASAAPPARAWQRAGPTDAARLVDVATLRDEFAGLTVVVAREVAVHLREGKFHRGPATLTQFVARRPRDEPLALRCRAYPDAVQQAFAEAARLRAADSPSFAGQPDAAPAASWMIDAEGGDKCVSDAAFDAAMQRIAAGALREYRAAVDDDLLLSCSAALVRISCAASARWECCRLCWLPMAQCICSAVRCEHRRMLTAPALGMAAHHARCRGPRVHWVILSHPAEFLRATSTAKLVVQLLGSSVAAATTQDAALGGDAASGDDGSGGRDECGASGSGRDTCEWLLYGCHAHLARLDDLLCSATRQPAGPAGGRAVRVLFPRDKGDSAVDTVAEALAAAAWTDRAEPAAAVAPAAEPVDALDARPDGPGSDGAGELVLLVPDGSWECARALVHDLRRRASRYVAEPLRAVELDPQRVAAHRSALLDALHPGAGRGRLSSLEAVALFCEEAASVGGATMAPSAPEAAPAVPEAIALRHALTHIVEYVHRMRRDEAATENAAADGAGGSSARATSKAHAHHAEWGRRHCEAVARRYLCTATPDARPDASAAAAALHECSTLPLSRARVEPPDLALALLNDVRLEDGDHHATGSAVVELA